MTLSPKFTQAIDELVESVRFLEQAIRAPASDDNTNLIRQRQDTYFAARSALERLIAGQ